MDIENFIKNGLRDLLKSYKKRSNKPSIKRKYNKYKKKNIKIKKFDGLVKESNLKAIDPKLKYAKYITKDKSYDPDAHQIRPKVNGDAYDSSMITVAPEPGPSLGWGNSEYATLGFGEALNSQKSEFIKYINDLYQSNPTKENDIFLNTIIKSYKILFDNIESKQTLVLLGMQPSLDEYILDEIDAFVFSLNNFTGDIVSLYIGSSHDVDSEDDIRSWYKDIGVHDEIIDKIIFIEYNLETIPISLFDFEENVNKCDGLNTYEDLLDITKEFTKPILVGCFDSYFMFMLISAFTENNLAYELDRRFSYLLDSK